MKQTVRVELPLSRENAKKCICWQCPVQDNSQCIKENSDKMGEVMTSKFFDPKIVPGLYCTSGAASCQDIDDMAISSNWEEAD